MTKEQIYKQALEEIITHPKYTASDYIDIKNQSEDTKKIFNLLENAVNNWSKLFRNIASNALEEDRKERG